VKYRIPSWTLTFIACTLWSTAFVGVKYALTFAPPIFIAGIRFMLAGVVLIPFAGFKGYLHEFKKHYRIILLVGFLQTFLVYFFYFMALTRIKASTASSLIGLGPMIGAIMGHIFVKNDNFTKRKIFSFILGVIGVTLVSLSGGKNGSLPEMKEIIGIILFIINQIGGGFSNVFVLRYKSDIKSGVLTSAQLFIGGFMLFVLSFFMYDNLTFVYPVKFYIALGWLVFVSATGFSLWYHLLSTRKESLISMNIWKFVMPVVGGLLGWIIMPNDSPTVKAVLGMLIVALSIFIYYIKPRNSNRL